MRSTTVLDRVRVASPCREAWDTMPGDDRVRSCTSCQRHVYNLSAMTAADAAALVERAEGRTCVRFYRRGDGTMLTADCPEGAREARRGRLRRLSSCAVVALTVVVTAPFARGGSGRGWRPHLVPMPSGPGVTLRDWADWALDVLDIRPEPVDILGEMECRPIEAPPLPPAPPLPARG